VNAVNIVYVVIIVVLLPFPASHTVMSHLCQLYTAVIILAKMFYQLHWIPDDFAQSNCTVCDEPNSHGLDLLNLFVIIGVHLTPVVKIPGYCY